MKFQSQKLLYIWLLVSIGCDKDVSNNAHQGYYKDTSNSAHQEGWTLNEKRESYGSIFGDSDFARKEYLRNKNDDFYIQEFRRRCPDFDNANMREMFSESKINFTLSLLELFSDKACDETCTQSCHVPPQMQNVVIHIRFPLFESRWFSLTSYSFGKNYFDIPDMYKFTAHEHNVSFELTRGNLEKTISFNISEYSCPEKDLLGTENFIDKFRRMDIVVEDPSTKYFWVYPTIKFKDENLIKTGDFWMISQNDFGVLNSVHTKNLNHCNGSIKIVRSEDINRDGTK